MHQEEPYWSRPERPRLSRRRLLSLAGATGAGLSIAACGSRRPKTGGASSASRGPGEAPQPGGTFTWFVNRNPVVDPQKAQSEQAASAVYSRVFQFKTGVDPKAALDHDIENDLGVNAESPDAVTWTVKLRPDARFHNVAPVSGHALEAEDVKATFVRAVNPATGNPNGGSLDMIDPAQIQTPDKTTVVFKLKYPYAPFRKTLASPLYSLILPREALAGTYDPSRLVIGSGPFTLESATPDVAWTYKRNHEWLQKAGPYVDAMRMAIVPDASQQLAQFTGGNIDEIGATINQQFNAFDIDPIQRSNPKARMLKVSDAIPNAIFFQLGDPKSPFLDIRVRRAFSMAIDREVIGKVVWGGQSEQVVHVPAYMGKWSMRVQDLDPKVQQFFKYNPSEAKKLLEAAGATNLQLKLTSSNVFATPPFLKSAETIANFLNNVGVKSTLVIVDHNKDYIAGGKGLKAGNYAPDTVLLTAQARFTDADEFLFNFFDSKSTSNNGRLSDPTLDAMIDRERTLVNEDDRLKAVMDVHRYLAEHMYNVPTVGTYRWVFLQDRVQGYQYSDTTGRSTETYTKLWLKT